MLEGYGFNLYAAMISFLIRCDNPTSQLGKKATLAN
jgi:hypothetical protein